MSKILKTILIIGLCFSSLVGTVKAYESYEGIQIIKGTIFRNSVEPLTDNTYDFGSAAKKWANVHGTNIHGETYVISGGVTNLGIEIRHGFTGTPDAADDMWMIFNRGAASDTQLFWDEGDDQLKLIAGGTTGLTLDTSGNATIAGDLTISGDDLVMATNTAGYLLVADGTNFNPTNTISASVDTSTLLTIQNTDMEVGSYGYLLELLHNSNNDEDANFIICQDNAGGTPDTVFSVAYTGTLTVGSSGNSTFNESVGIGNGSANIIDMGADANADLFITDDLEIDGSAYFAGDLTISAGVLTGGGLQFNHQTLTAATLTLDKNDGVVECDTTSNANAITLPECSTVLGQIYTIYFETDNAADVTVAVAAGDTFADVADIGDTLATMADVGDFIVIQAVSDTRWAIIQNNGATLTTP